MKLRNKRTGKIGNLLPYGCEDGKIWVWIENMSRPEYRYDSLAELSSEWEDYEEPKQNWFIATDGRVLECNENAYWNDYWSCEKKIGNYFETKEEAEKAVEKLKAWKRLKDKGFEFEDWAVRGEWGLTIYARYSRAGIKNDLDLLFGGEE